MSSPLEASADPGKLTSFEPPKNENESNSSSVFQFMVNLFTPKKEDQKKPVNSTKESKNEAPSRPNLLDLQNLSQFSNTQLAKSTVLHHPGSEVELRLRPLAAILKDFPKFMKGFQPGRNEQTEVRDSEGDTISRSLSAAELRQYWMPDEQCHECYECGGRFTTFRRRHHCRICGQIFCSQCCNRLISGKIMGLPGTSPLRSCTYCCKLVLMFAEGNSPKSIINSSSHVANSKLDTAMDDYAVDAGTVNESMLSFGGSHPLLVTPQNMVQSQSNATLRRSSQAASAAPRHDTPAEEDDFFTRGHFEALRPASVLSPVKDSSGWKAPAPAYIFDATPEVVTPAVLGNDIKDDLVQDSSQLHSLWRKICDEKCGIEFRDHRLRLRKYSNCITGQELLDWLIGSDVASTRAQGCAIGQALYEGKWLKPVADIGGVFQDGYVLFQSGRKPSSSSKENRIEIYPDHFADISNDGEPETLQDMAEREPIWVQEIKCGNEDQEDSGDESSRYCEDASESEMASSDVTPTNLNESLLYSDEERSVSEKSVVSLSSFVEIDEGNDVIKYTRPSSPGTNSQTLGQQTNSHTIQPECDDSSLTNVSADYLRNLITWNGLNQSSITPSPGWRENDLESNFLESHDKRAFQWLREMYLRHNLTLLRQLLRDKGLSLSWAEVLVPLAKHAVEHISLNPNVSIDVCHYFQIKKVPDGPRDESEIVNGVVCTKNVVHRQMRTDIVDPSILLLAIPLEYQRVQLKLAALDPIVRQEREFYKHLISRITARQPQVVLVQYVVSHIAQELLLQAGITLVINVKPSVMERVARSTEADIVYSIDQLVHAKLGHCSRFYIKLHQILTPRFHNGKICSKHTTKTLMYFDGCSPTLGCTAILRGNTDNVLTDGDLLQELSDVKDVLQFLVRALLHARLELSYLIDQHGFGRLLKKHSTSKQTHTCKSKSGSTAKDSETECQNVCFESYPNESKQFKCTVEDLSTAGVDGSIGGTTASQNGSSFSNQHKVSLVPLTSPDEGRNSINTSTIGSPGAANRCLQFVEALKLILLSISPLVQSQLPFLLTSQGQQSPIHKFLPKMLFWSHCFEDKSAKLKRKFLDAVDVDHREAMQSRSSTMESLVPQDRLWLNPPHHHFKSAQSSELEEATAFADTLDIDPGLQEVGIGVSEEGSMTPVLQQERSTSNVSCYSQQYKQHKNEGIRNKSDDFASVQLNDNAKLHNWEQRVLDMIFGPPAFLHSENREKFVLSPEYSPKNTPRMKCHRHFTFKNELNSTITNEVVSGLNHDVENSIYSESGQQHLHEFISCSITEPASAKKVQDLIANYRAYSGLLGRQEHELEQSLRNDTFTNVHSDLDNNESPSVKDCMDPANHQHVCALFSSYSPQSPNAPYFCVLPWLVDIDFYRGNDITLGGFLERYCFRPSYHCPSATCRRSMVEHIRSFTHGNMCMTVVLKELSKAFQESSILTWNWNYVTRKSSDIKIMSHDAWSMSFAKYLELNLGRLMIPDCSSSLHYHKGLLKQDIFGEEWELKPSTTFQYFLFRDIVAAFKCFPININEVVLPSFRLSDPNVGCDVQICQICGEYHEYAITCDDLYFAVESLGEKVSETIETIQDCIESSRASKSGMETFCDQSLVSREKYFSDLTNSLREERTHLSDEVNLLKRLLRLTPSDLWEQTTVPVSDVLVGNEPDLEEDPPLHDDLAKEATAKILGLKCELSEIVQTWNEKLAEAHEKDRSSYWTSGKVKPGGLPQPQSKLNAESVVKTTEAARGHGTLESTEFSHSPPRFHLGGLAEEEEDLSVRSTEEQSSSELSNIRESRLIKTKQVLHTNGKNVEKAMSYKRLSRTGSSVKFLVTRLLPGNVLIPSVSMPFPSDEHFLLPECLQTNVVVRDAEPSSIIAYTLSSKNYKAALAELTASSQNSMEAGSMMSDPPNKHDQKVARPNGPGCEQDSQQISDTNSWLDASQENPTVVSMGSLMTEQHEVEGSQEVPALSFSSSHLPTMPNSPHVEIQFSDTTTRFYCKVYFAKLFENLRSKVLEGGEMQYMSSLSRSMKWLARGGKSGSTFHKTKDDQFILKQMSYFELQSFLEFASKYVDYIGNCIENQEATAISKILGVYRISFRNSETGCSLKQDVLVIENLFYRRKIKQIFDLKGSVRNRHVKASTSKDTADIGTEGDQNDIVLQDENLLKMMCENPIYVHEHTKHLLMSALIRDTELLSSNLIMDYSLLVGVGEDKQIVVGIIDFIRTFTWDKKLEMVVKWSSSRSMPTVVSPELYKNRFCEAMERYFQAVPDRWHSMQAY